MQAAVQEFIDASVSKTVNCPPNMTFEDFRQVYDMAWAKGCKGCTTYRPSEVRGSILEVAKSDKQVAKIEKPVAGPVVTPASSSVLDPAARGVQVRKRDRVLEGRTYKIDWPGLAAAIYITINHNDYGQPEEVFISSKNSQYAEWSVALSVMISKLMKLTQNPYMVSEELQQINLSMNPAWVKGKFYGSVISQIGAIIKEHADEFADMAYIEHYTKELSKVTGEEMVLPAPSEALEVVPEEMGKQENTRGKQCPACGSPNLVMKEGCLACADCGQSKCG
jgi:ribonucleoside-diphosphate reductase alpha chain